MSTAIPSRRAAALLAALLLAPAAPALAQAPISAEYDNPWTQTINNIAGMFVGPIATAVSMIAMVIGGAMFAFGEPGSKKMVAGLIFGVGMALGAVQLVEWLRPEDSGTGTGRVIEEPAALVAVA